MKSRVAVLIACSGLVAAGCGVAPSSPPEGTSVTEVDGVRVVENVAPAWPGNEPWTISPEPVLTLGVDIGAPEQMFTAIRTPFALSDGRIVVVDFANAVRLFDAAGSSTGSVGRAGEGPCEFRQVIAAYPAGDDSILVWDSRLRRFVLFDSSGECVGTHSLEGHGEDYGSASVAGRFADGSLFARAYDALPRGVAGTRLWRTAAFFRYQPDGRAPRLLFELPFLEAVIGSELAVVFGARPVIVAHGDNVFHAPGETTEVRVYDVDGNLVQRFSRRYEAQPVTQADRDTWMEVSRRNVDALQRDREFGQRMLSLATFADVKPAIRGLLVDELGNVWVERHLGLAHTRPIMIGQARESFGAEETSTWDVFSPDGIWLGPVALVPGRTPSFIGADYVLMPGIDDAGVAHVWKYALNKPH